MGELSYRAQMLSDDNLSWWAGGSQGSAKLLDSKSLFIFQSHDATFSREVSKGWLSKGLKSARDEIVSLWTCSLSTSPHHRHSSQHLCRTLLLTQGFWSKSLFAALAGEMRLSLPNADRQKHQEKPSA